MMFAVIDDTKTAYMNEDGEILVRDTHRKCIYKIDRAAVKMEFASATAIPNDIRNTFGYALAKRENINKGFRYWEDAKYACGPIGTTYCRQISNRGPIETFFQEGFEADRAVWVQGNTSGEMNVRIFEIKAGNFYVGNDRIIGEITDISRDTMTLERDKQQYRYHVNDIVPAEHAVVRSLKTGEQFGYVKGMPIDEIVARKCAVFGDIIFSNGQYGPFLGDWRILGENESVKECSSTVNVSDENPNILHVYEMLGYNVINEEFCVFPGTFKSVNRSDLRRSMSSDGEKLTKLQFLDAFKAAYQFSNEANKARLLSLLEKFV